MCLKNPCLDAVVSLKNCSLVVMSFILPHVMKLPVSQSLHTKKLYLWRDMDVNCSWCDADGHKNQSFVSLFPALHLLYLLATVNKRLRF